jgi:hypothetical protein
MTPTEGLIQAAARLESAALLGRDPTDAILFGTLLLDAPPPWPGHPTAKRALAVAAFLRAWAALEPADRAAALIERAEAQDVIAELALATMPRTDA